MGALPATARRSFPAVSERAIAANDVSTAETKKAFSEAVS